MKPINIFLLFGLTLSIFFSSGQIENPDTHLRLTQTRLLLQNERLGLGDEVGELMHGNVAINHEGERHMVYNPGQSIIFIPIYVIGNLLFSEDYNTYYFAAFMVSFVNFFIHALSAFVLFKIALKLGASKRKAYLISAFFGITSYSFVFAQSTYEHHFESLFVLLSILNALTKDTKNYAIKSGLMLTIGLIFRSSTILAVPGIILLFKDNLSKIKFMFSLSIGVLFVLAYNYFRFGNIIETGYSIAWSLAHPVNIDFWSFSRIPIGMLGLLISPGKGLLFFSFTIMIAVLGMKKFWAEYKRLSMCIILITATYLIVFSMNFAWHGSIWSFGPRYILPILPMLYLPLIFIKNSKWINITLIFSFILQMGLLTVNYKRNVLEQHVKFNGISDITYTSSIGNEPHLAQAKQLSIILPKNHGELKNYQPNTPWIKEVRTASNKDVLGSSIEKNSINFWWVRIFHWNTAWVTRFIAILVLIIGLLAARKLINTVKHEFL